MHWNKCTICNSNICIEPFIYTTVKDVTKTVNEEVVVFSLFNNFIKITKEVPTQKTYEKEVKVKDYFCQYCVNTYAKYIPNLDNYYRRGA